MSKRTAAELLVICLLLGAFGVYRTISVNNSKPGTTVENTVTGIPDPSIKSPGISKPGNNEENDDEFEDDENEEGDDDE